MPGKFVYSQERLLEFRSKTEIPLRLIKETPNEIGLSRKPSTVSSLEKTCSILQDDRKPCITETKNTLGSLVDYDCLLYQRYYEDEENGDKQILSSHRHLKELLGSYMYFDTYFCVPLVECFVYSPLPDMLNLTDTVHSTTFQGYLEEYPDPSRPREHSRKEYIFRRNTKRRLKKKNFKEDKAKYYPRYDTTSMPKADVNNVPRQSEEIVNSSTRTKSLYKCDRKIDTLSSHGSSSDSSIYIKISP